MALYELYWLNKPPHAVIDQAVRICKSGKYRHQANFVNAILRQSTPPKSICVTDNFPEWLQMLWDQYPHWLSSLQTPPFKSLVANGELDAEMLGLDLRPATIQGQIVDDVYHCFSSGSVSEWGGFDTGDWWIMNPAAAHVVDIVWDTIQKEFSKQTVTVLDLCAAPGGKTFRFVSRGAQVCSIDGSTKRIHRMNENLERLGMNVEVVNRDLSESHTDLGLYDIVFLDAPCSGLGVIRKHPEIRWNRTESDIMAASIRQRRFLSCAKDYVNSFGLLAYCVCSLHPMEGQHVIDDFLKKNPLWTVVRQWETPIADPLVEEELLDGFQLFVLKRMEKNDDKK